jgi:AraC-like DNA-binding protein
MIARTAAMPARYFSFILSYTDELRLPGRPLMRAAGLTRAQIAVPDAFVPLAQFDALVQAVNVATGRTDLGFELGQRVTYGLHDKLGDALVHCRDLDEALRLCSRYFSSITPSYLMEYHRGPRLASVCFRPTVAMPHETLAVLSETHAVSFHRLGLRATPHRIPPYELRMPIPRPAHIARYSQLAPARVRFEPGALPEVRMEVPSDFMDSAFTSHDPQRVTERQAQLNSASQAAIDTGHYGDWLKMLLLHAEGYQLKLADAASALQLPPHTLARRLAAEGIEFRELSNEVRMRRAAEMLAASDAPIATVAARLGYMHTSNFSGAFRARHGVSPRQYRQSHQGPRTRKAQEERSE